VAGEGLKMKLFFLPFFSFSFSLATMKNLRCFPLIAEFFSSFSPPPLHSKMEIEMHCGRRRRRKKVGGG
jgi:hypothetical protein